MVQNVIACSILICGRITYVLFDIGAFQSFSFIGYVKMFEHVTKLLNEPVCIATSVGKSSLMEHVCKSYSLKIGFLEFVIDLIVLGIADFDIILGWASCLKITSL